MCSSCGATGPRYCSQECQTTGWTQGHFSVCVANLNPPRSAGGHNADGGETPTSPTVRRSTSTTRRRKSQRLSMGRWNAAQLINARHRANTSTDQTVPISPNTSHSLPAIPLSNLGPSAAPPTGGALDAEAAEELKFYMHQIYLVIQPVVLCIVLSIFWVKIAFSGKSDYRPVRASYLVYSETSSGDATTAQFFGSLVNAAIIITQIIVVTIVIVCLFKHGFIKVGVSIISHAEWHLGFANRLFHDHCARPSGFHGLPLAPVCMSSTFASLFPQNPFFWLIAPLSPIPFTPRRRNLIEVFVIPLDYPTMIFGLWNFAVVGLVSVFWKGPLWLQQSYLTVMSSLMAFSLTGLEQWTTWMLLGLLAIWGTGSTLHSFFHL
ncbi:hypothetical protein BC938DRAFT_471630 [Jimgerdemannia flammicorona]|uniref:Presenilin-domain-containing protein n=1 Tax=Jimgerdemannia flammicorona TaxID=994334 RepID=A0A433Q7R4_9FUNG|nr:hypothetical protein BC938DRAFT_471630 [Jimgerdemannia flammicorona]